MIRPRRRLSPSQPRRPDVVLLGAAGLLIVLGALELQSTGAVKAAVFGSRASLLSRHLFRLSMGFFVFMIAAMKDPLSWRKYSKGLLLGSLMLLIPLVLSRIGLDLGTLCPERNGANRALSLGSISISPGEALKLTFVLWLANFLSLETIDATGVKARWIPIGVLGVATGLLLILPSFSTAAGLIILTTGILFLAGVPSAKLVKMVGVGLVTLSIALPLSGYRLQRFADYQAPWTCIPDEHSYHARQSLIALGSGGLYGRGIGNGIHAYGFLPEIHTDYPMAAVGAETGLLGSSIVVILFALVLFRGMKIAIDALDKFRFLLASGLTLSLTLFALVNAGVTTTLLPATGQTMPFLSYGGVSTVVSLFSIGVLDAIHRSSQ